MESTMTMAAKEPILSLLFGTLFVCFITLPYFMGIGKSLATQQNNPEASLIKFLALPFALHLIATIVAITFTNMWDLLFTDLQSGKLINTFWSASAEGATNVWVKSAYNSADLMSMVLYYLIIAIPAVNFVAVYILSDRLIQFKDQDAWGGLKSNAVKIAGSMAVAAILTIFYQKTVDVTMFNGQSLNFKEWGSASNSAEMHANFYKRISKNGITGKLTTGTRGTSSTSSTSSSQGSLLDAYFNKTL